MSGKGRVPQKVIYKDKRASDRMNVNGIVGDNSKYLAHTLQMWDWEKPDMKSKEAVSQRIEDYFTLCMKDDIKPSVEGLAYAFNVNRKTFYDWAHTAARTPKMPDEVRSLIQKAYHLLNVQMTNYMQNGKINPVAGIFLMKNNMDYEDKKEITVAPVNPLGEETSAEELHRKYIDTIDIESAEGAESD